MAYIELNNGLPGITGLLENRVDTAARSANSLKFYYVVKTV